MNSRLASMIASFRAKGRQACAPNCDYHSSCKDVELIDALIAEVEVNGRAATNLRTISDAAYAVVMSMDKPVIGSGAEAASAWKMARRLIKVLNQIHAPADCTEDSTCS